MGQRTSVVIVPAAERSAFRKRLESGEFEWRTVPHASFSVKGDGIVATLYKSGKLVVQGPEPELFIGRYVEGARAAPSKPKTSSSVGDVLDVGWPLVGSDECGKGDYFGPLVVCAVRLPEDDPELRKAGIGDSKRITDERILTLSTFLKERVEYTVRRLDPVDYNPAHKKAGSLNPLLADLHAAVLLELARPGDTLLVDQFARESLLEERLAGQPVKLVQRTRAERNLAVGAASILAREAFLTAMHELSEEYAIPLHKGAGSPVDRCGLQFARLHGVEALGQVAKLHFKNTHKVTQRL